MLKIVAAELLDKYSFLPGKAISYARKDFTLGEFSVHFAESDRKALLADEHFLLIPDMGYDSNLCLIEVMTVAAILNAEIKAPYILDVLLPYLPYGRYKDAGMCSANPFVAALMNIKNIGKIYTLDAHNIAVYKDLAQKLENISHFELFNNLADVRYCDALVVPDNGAIQRLPEYDKVYPIIKLEKSRTPDGKVIITCRDPKVYNIRSCIILDDIVDSAGTLLAAVEYLRGCGVSDISAFVTHGVFSKSAVDKIQRSELREMLIANVLNGCPDLGFSGCKVKVVSFNDALAKRLNKI